MTQITPVSPAAYAQLLDAYEELHQEHVALLDEVQEIHRVDLEGPPAVPPWEPPSEREADDDVGEGQGVDASDESTAVAYPGRTLRTLLAEGIGAPLVAVVPHLSYPSRALLVAAREKIGKSTYLRQAIAAASAGRPHLSGPALDPITVLYIALEDPRDDVVAGLRDAGADLDRVVVVLAEDVASESDYFLAVARPDMQWVVVDTLTELARICKLQNESDGSEVRRLMARLMVPVRRGTAGWTMVAHTSRAGSDPRGSTDWAATVDIVARMTAADTVTPIRTIDCRGRGIQPHTMTVRYDNGLYRLVRDGDAPAPVDPRRARMVELVTRNPGQFSRTGLVMAVGGNRNSAFVIATALVDERTIVAGKGGKLYPNPHGAGAADPQATL